MIENIASVANTLNTSKVFSGIAMIIMNFGSRYVISDITQVHEQLMTSRLFKILALFCMFFVGTRDVLIAMILTASFMVIVHGILNENRKYNLLNSKTVQAAYKENPVKEEEYKKALDVVKKYESIKSQQKEVLETYVDRAEVFRKAFAMI